MKSRHILWPLLALGLSCSGGTDSGTQPVNRAPTITFTFTKLGVVRNTTPVLSVAVDDPDGDPLTVTWTITRGTLTPQNSAKTQMQWAAPAIVGLDTVVVKVSDGALSSKVTEPIMVCYPATAARATFQKSQSPYIISLDAANPVLGIDEGFTSNVEAGTTLLLDNQGTRIDVTGEFITHGTPGEPVVIRPNARDLSCGTDDRGWWESIQVSHAAGPPNPGSIEFHNTEVWFANYGVRLLNDASATLDGCAIKCSGAAGVYHEGAGTLIMTDTEVSNGKVDGIVIGSNVSTSVPDSVLINNCDIQFNQHNGVLLSVNDPGETAVVQMEYNYIKNNFFRGVTLARAVFPAMHFNLFSGNTSGGGSMNIYLEDGFGAGSAVTTLDATCNYFSVTTQTAIDATIRDSLDNPVLAPVRVLTDPWLTVDPRTNPVCP